MEIDKDMPDEVLNILLVEAKEDDYRTMAGLLAQITFPHQVQWVKSYVEAEGLVQGCHHDVLLVDCSHEDHGGIELIRHCQKVGCLSPVIIMTGEEDRDHDIQAMQAGAADYLVKARVTPSLLERSIRYAVAQKRSEEALRKSEKRLASAQRIAHLGNWDWQIESGELYWSDEIFRIFGHEPGAFIPTYEMFLQYVHPVDKQVLNRAINEALYDQKPFEVEHRIVLQDGTERIVLQQGEVTYCDLGKPIRMVGTVQDVTSRRASEEALRLMEEKFSKAFLNSPDWVAISRAADGRYIEVNETFLQITGYTREEVIGSTSIELGIWANPKERIAMRRCAFRNQRPV